MTIILEMVAADDREKAMRACWDAGETSADVVAYMAECCGWPVRATLSSDLAAHRQAAYNAGRIEGEREAVERAAQIAETLRVGGGTLSSWVNANESPMGATQRHIAAAIRASHPERRSENG